jgi:PAS domain S-box-containing protein
VAIGPSVGCCGTAAFLVKPVFVEDIELDPLWDDYRELARSIGVRSCWSTPIQGSGGVCLGTFAIYRRAPRLPSPRERRLIEDGARLAQLMIERERSATALKVSGDRLLAELAAERTLLAAVLDHLPSAVMIAEAPSGRFIRGNQRVEKIFGHPMRYSDDTARYVDDWPARFPDGELAGQNEGPLARAIRTGATTVGAEFRYPRPDNAEAWIRVSAAPIRDPEGRVTGGVMTAEDISAEKALESQLQQAQRLEAVGRLAGGIAHDFNNLLTVIQANADFTLEDLPAGHPAVSSIEEVLDAADRAAQVTRQLLAFSRKQILTPTQLDLEHYLADAATRLRQELPPDIQLRFTPPREPIGVRADRAQLDQVLLNLVVNAREALPMGGTITLEAERESVGAGVVWEQEPVRPGEYARVAVSDDGTGMDDVTVSRIFEPFFTTKPAFAGSGLGLSTVHGIVRQSGGWIRVETELGRGTTIAVLLPVVAGRPPSGPKEAAARGSLRGTELVLLVEDEPLVRSSTRRVLERLGYRVIEAQHGAEALVMWEARRAEIDLVLTDVMMPELGGTELAERLRAVEPKVRIVFMSGYVGDDTGANGPATGRERLLQKPFSADALGRLVRAALDA